MLDKCVAIRFLAYRTGGPNSHLGGRQWLDYPLVSDPGGSCLSVMRMWHTYQICYRLQVKCKLSYRMAEKRSVSLCTRTSSKT